jgi:cytochrome P450
MKDDYNYYSDEFQSDPPATYQRMMQHCPVHYSEMWGWYSVFRNADIQTIINDHKTYSVRMGPGPTRSQGNGGVLVATDPPQHMLEKRLVGRVFNLQLMESFEPELRHYVGELLDRIAPRGRCDFIEEVAIPVPLWIICRLLDVDFERWGRPMRDWVYVLAGAVFSQDRDMAAEVVPASMGLRAFLEPLVDQAIAKRESGEAPGKGLIDQLAAAEVDGMRLDKEQLMGFGSFVVIAGSGTTTNSIGNFFAGMIDHPDQYALLRQRPELLPNAVDEIIRFYAPVPGLFRTNNKPVNLQGVEIPADSKICVMWGSANRDPELFDHPNELDITRDLDELKRKNLAFGGGIHRCMGAPLSRMEIRVVVDEWMKRIAEFREYAPRVPYPHATLIGDDHLYVEWEPAAR